MAAQGTFLPKGRAYISIYGEPSWQSWGKTYTLNVGHTPGNVETEVNFSTGTADLIKVGTTYSGSSLTSSYDDYDYFAVDMPSDGRAMLNLKFPANLGTSKAYEVTVFDASGKKLYYFDVPASANSGAWLAAQGTFLPKGRAYISISGESSWQSWGKTYTLNVGNTPGNVETEDNYSTATADLIKLGTTYSGSSLTSTYYDDDYFAVDMPTSGRVSVSLLYPASSGSNSAYNVSIINSSGNELYSFSQLTDEGNGKWLAARSISLPKGRSYIQVEGQSSWASWGKTYTLNISGVLTATPVPTISGTAKVGSVLTVKAGTWSPAPVTLKYQWLRNGKTISGATASTYKLVAADGGSKITVKVTGSKTGYNSVAKASAAVSVPLVSLTATPVPTIAGTAKVGSVLTAKAGTWSPAPVTLKYQWLRNGKTISGATASTYKLLAADGGSKITVTVTGSKANYKAVTKTSGAKTILK